MRRLHQWSAVGLVLAVTVGLDRASKLVAIATLKDVPTRSFLGDTFRLGYAENPGAFLGMGGNLPSAIQFWVFVVGVGIVLAAMLVWMVSSRKIDTWTAAGLAMIVGGGGSNWVDRVLNDGRVVDFLNLGIGSLRTGIFNVADVAIMAGAVMLAFSGAKQDKDNKAEQATAS